MRMVNRGHSTCFENCSKHSEYKSHILCLASNYKKIKIDIWKRNMANKNDCLPKFDFILKSGKNINGSDEVSNVQVIVG